MTEADCLTATVERDGVVCVLTLGGELDVTTVAAFAEPAAVALESRPERLILDLSALSFLDCCGARALAATAQAVPAGCPVILRSANPAVRRLLDLLELDLERRDVVPASRTVPPALNTMLLFSSAQHARTESCRLAGAVAATQDRVADTLIRLAGSRPREASRLSTLSRIARTRAAHARSKTTG